MLAPLDEILSNFELLEDWEERYRYLIELGRMMPPLPERPDGKPGVREVE